MVVVAAILCGVAGWAVVLGCVVARFRNVNDAMWSGRGALRSADGGARVQDERLSWSSSMFTIWLDGAPWADGLRRRMALHRRPAARAWRRWFAIGPPIAVVLMVVSAVVLLTNFVRVFLLLASPGAHVAHADVPSTLVGQRYAPLIRVSQCLPDPALYSPPYSGGHVPNLADRVPVGRRPCLRRHSRNRARRLRHRLRCKVSRRSLDRLT